MLKSWPTITLYRAQPAVGAYEVARPSFFDARCLRTSLTASVRFKGQPAFFIIHIETQSQAQKQFGRRLFRYFSRLHDKHGLPVYPIAVFSFELPRTPQSNSYRVEFPNKVVNEFRYDVIQLNRLNWRDFLKKPNPVAAALMAKMNIAPKERVRVKLECLRLLVTLRLDPARTKLISGFIDTYLKLNEIEQEEFDVEIRAQTSGETEQVMEIVTSWMEEGLRRGPSGGRRARTDKSFPGSCRGDSGSAI